MSVTKKEYSVFVLECEKHQKSLHWDEEFSDEPFTLTVTNFGWGYSSKHYFCPECLAELGLKAGKVIE